MSEQRIIDLRSDTVTHPTPAMRDAMAKAEVGDDVFGEDPTVHRLEAQAAELMGKEAAVFVASGTMGNLTCLLAHCQRGDEAIVGSESHGLQYEVAGAASICTSTARQELHEGDELREQIMQRVPQPELDRDPEQKGIAVLIRVDRLEEAFGKVSQRREGRDAA